MKIGRLEGWKVRRTEGRKFGRFEGRKFSLQAERHRREARREKFPVKSVSSRQSTYQSHNFVSRMMTPQVEPVNVVLAFSTRCPWVSLGGIGQAERSDDDDIAAVADDDDDNVADDDDNTPVVNSGSNTTANDDDDPHTNAAETDLVIILIVLSLFHHNVHLPRAFSHFPPPPQPSSKRL